MKMHLLKTLYLIILTSAYYFNAMAQTNEEQQIRKLEQQESHAVITGNLPGLLNTYWSPLLIVNNPANIVVTRPQIVELIKSGKIDYSSFKKFIEKISIIGNTAIVMGREEVNPKGVTDNAGKKVIRRYTNVWMKLDNKWSLVARQATITVIQ